MMGARTPPGSLFRGQADRVRLNRGAWVMEMIAWNNSLGLKSKKGGLGAKKHSKYRSKYTKHDK